MLPVAIVIAVIIVVVLILIPLLVTPFLRTVEAGSIRMVSWPGQILRDPLDDHRHHPFQ